MLKTLDAMTHRKTLAALAAPRETGLRLRRVIATTALATGVIAGMMLFQPNAAMAQVGGNGNPGADGAPGVGGAGGTGGAQGGGGVGGGGTGGPGGINGGGGANGTGPNIGGGGSGGGLGGAGGGAETGGNGGASFNPGSGGGGGGGGGRGNTFTLLNPTINAVATGGNGGNGGAGVGVNASSGGGGGGGGIGAVADTLATGTLTINAAVTGGNGGNGGSGALVGNDNGGGGGAGGAGLLVQAAVPLAVSVNAAVTGGAGGAGGNGSGPGVGGPGGVGISGSNLTINLGAAGSITGGAGNGGQAFAIDYTGGTNALSITAGGTISGGINVGGGSLDFAQATAAIVNNVISGAGAISKSGAGVLTLSGTNTYSGGTTVSGGTLAINASNNLGAATGGITLNGGGILQATLAGTLTLPATRAISVGAGGGAIDTPLVGNVIQIDGVITSAGGNVLTKSGLGQLTLTNAGNAGTFAGGITLAGGTLRIGATGAAGTGTIRTTGSVIDYADTVDNAAPIQIAGGTTQLQVLVGAATQSGVISEDLAAAPAGPKPLEKIGAGTLALTAVNTYTGATTITAGTLQANSSDSLGTGVATNTLIFNGGTLQATGAIASPATRGVTLTATGIIDTNNNPVSIAGVISGAGGLTKNGAGTLTLLPTGINTYTGATLINVGVLNIQNATSLGAIGPVGGGSDTTVAAGAALELQGGIAVGAEGLTLNGSGIANDGALRNISGVNSFAGPIALASASRINSDLDTLTLSGGIAGAFALTVGGAGNTTITTAPIAANIASVTKDGAGTLNLSVAHTYAGATTVNGGILLAGLANAFSAASPTTVNAGGTLNLGGFAQTVNNVTLAGGTLFNGSLNGTVTSTGGTVNNITAGPAVLVLTGGTTTALGANGYTGTTTINNGATLAGGNANALSATSATTVSTGGTLALGAVAQTVNATSLAGGTIQNGQLTGAVTSTGGAIANLGTAATVFALNSGTTTATGANTYTGTTTINAGATLMGGGASALSATSATTVNGGGTLNLGNVAQTVNNVALAGGVLTTGTLAGAVASTGGTINNTLGTSTVTTTAGMTTVTGVNAFVATVNGGNLRVDGTFTGGGAVNNTGTISGNGSITGLVTINNGGTLSAGQSPGLLTFNTGLTLAAGSVSNFELNSPGVVGGANNDQVIVSGGNLTINPGATLTASVASAGFYRLYTTTGGSAVSGNFAPANVTITGGAAGLGGTTYVNSPGTTTQVNLVVLGAGQVLQFWDGADSTGNGVADGGTGTWNAVDTNWTSNVTGQQGVNGAWQRSVGVFAGTAGTVTVVGTQSFQTLQFSTTGYTLTGGQIALGAAGANINTDNGVTATINSAIVNGGGTSLEKVGAGTLVLGGVNTFTGGTTVTSGTLQLSSGGQLASGVTVNNGSIFTTAGTIQGGLTNAGATTASGNGTINGVIANNGAGTFTVNGVLGGNGSFTNNNTAANAVSVLTGAILSIPTITNAAGTFTSTGALVASTLFNNVATVNAAGSISTAELRNSGAFNVTGTLGGAVTTLNNNSGGTLAVGANTFNGVGTLNNSGRVTLAGGTINAAAIVNNALFNTSGSSVIGGTFTNLAGGTLTLASGSTLTTAGNLVNNGSINLANNFAGDRVIVGGNISGNGAVALDVDINARASDTIRVVGGGSSGQQAVTLSRLGGLGVIVNADLPVVSGASGAQFISTVSLPTNNTSPFPVGGQLLNNDGLVQYWFGETTPGSGNFVVRPDLNVAAASSFVASVSSALSSINAFSEPASAFISGPSDPGPNTFSLGSWGRVRGGQFDITSNSIVGSPNGVNRSFRSTNEAGFSGFQLGLDAGLYNINGSGWSANLGVHGGKVDAKVTSPDTTLHVDQPFYGVYGALRSGSGFAFDVLVRRDDFDLKLNSPGALPSQVKFKADGWSGLASMTQRFNITDSIYIDPSIALLYSRAEVDPLRSGQVTVNWQPIESITGRFGVQVGTFLQPTEAIIVAPYVALSVWREFAGATKADGQFGGLSFPTVTDRVGTYGQASLGVAVSSTTPGLSGFLRGDLRFGDRIEGYALNGGLRYQF